jgi:hypothetical protein
MDELTLVARLRHDIPAGTDLTGPERRLAAEIRAASAPSAAHSRPRTIRRYGRRLAIAGTLAAALAITIPIAASQPAGRGPRTGAGPAAPIAGLAATNAAELVAYATRAAAAAPAFDPKPHQWIYTKQMVALAGKDGTTLIGPPYKLVTFQGWTRADYRLEAAIKHGRLMISQCACRGGFIGGWPFGFPIDYPYLDSLPASPAKLKAVIAANIARRSMGMSGGDIGIFDAIKALMGNAVLPARLDATFYRLLATLRGVHFDGSATDIAGRHEVGFYAIENGYRKMEIVINPTTYAYVGEKEVAIKSHTDVATDRTLHFRKGELLDWTGLLQAGVVQHAGQLP